MRIGRVLSALTGRAALNGSFAFLTQMLRVPWYGFRNEMYRPSGEICALAMVISPKKRLRSMIGGWSARAAIGAVRVPSATRVRAKHFIRASREGEPEF